MLTYLFYIIYLFYFKKTKDKYARIVFEINVPCLKHKDWYVICQNQPKWRIQCFVIGRQPGNRAWPITRYPNKIALSNLDAFDIIWAF